MQVFRIADPGGTAGGEQREGNVLPIGTVCRFCGGIPLQLLRQLLRFLHDGEVRAETGVKHRVKAHHAHGGEYPADAVFAGLHAEGLADGHADSRSDLGDNALFRIVEFAPDAVMAGLDTDGGGGTDGGALAAVDAVGFRQLLSEGRCDDGFGAALSEVDGSHMLHFVADSHAVAAEDALAGIADDGRRGVVNGLRLSRIGKTDVVQLQPRGEFLQAAGLVFLTDGAVPAVRRQQQLQDHPSVMLQPWRVCFDDHAVFGRSGAGSDQAAPLVLHHTHAACAVNGKIGIIAQGGNVDAHAVDHLENVLFLIKIRPDAVDNHIFSHSFFSLTVVMPVSGFQLIAWNGQPSLHAPHLIHLLTSMV